MKAKKIMAGCLLVLFCMIFANIFRVNLSYKEPQRLDYKLNEKVSLENGASMKVESFKFLNTAEYERYIKKNFPNETVEGKEGVKAILVKVKEHGKISGAGDLKQMQLNAGNFQNASAIEFNQTKKDISTYVYEIPSSLMTNDHFKNASKLKYRLAVRCYPKQIFVNLN
ncbi:hypothetical protein [Ligilactobacillus ruminis]|uniref:hypothetical protein n=1 Tax=Ligilactobacillus ruminis TaxID=1623 RepID=UPI003D07C289